MKARETVMSDYDASQIAKVFPEGVTGRVFLAIAEAQAEITGKIMFKAGMEEEAKGGTNALSYLKGHEKGERRGIREVVEYVIESKLLYGPDYDDKIAWRAKLKEWGIK